MKRSFRWSTQVAALLLFSVSGVLASEPVSADGDQVQAGPAEVGQTAPAFTLQDETGASISLADFQGKVVVLEWLNCDCPFVVRHAKAGTMKGLAEKYTSQDVVWLGVNSTHYANPEANQEWKANYGLSYPILSDPTGEVGKLYGARTTPHMFVIDAQGTLVYAGAVDDDPYGSAEEKLNYVDQAISEVQQGVEITVPVSKPYGCSVKYAS